MATGYPVWTITQVKRFYWFDLLPFVTICYDFRTLLKAQTDGRIALAAHRVANGNDEKIADHGIETYCSKPVRRSILSAKKVYAKAVGVSQFDFHCPVVGFCRRAEINASLFD